MTLIYLDNNTTAPPSPEVIRAMTPLLTTYWGSPMTPHQKGEELYPFLSKFYTTIYTCLGAQPNDQLVITSSGAEAVTHVISSIYRDVTLATGKNQFITSQLDEAASIMTITHLEPFGCVGKMGETMNGIISIEKLANSLSPRTALVSLSLANGLTGVVQPISEIATLCKERGIRLHVDITHAFGKLDCQFETLGVDYLTLHGEQIHGPRGVGILLVKQGIQCSPLIFGSADQGGMRAGSIPMANLAGIACALEEAIENRDFLCTETARLRNQLERGILKGFPSASVCFKKQERVPHCTTIFFPGIANESLLFSLHRKGICATIGGGNFQQLGILLSSAGIQQPLANQAISFSLSRYTTEEEIERAIPLIVESAKTLSSLSYPSFSIA